MEYSDGSRILERGFTLFKKKLVRCKVNVVLLTDYHTYQLRAYIYQARDMYASDKSGLSDPYAIVSYNRYSATTRVVKESVCPTWDQTILLSQIKLYGAPEIVRDSCPPVVVQFYDKDMVVRLLSWSWEVGI